MSKRRPGSKHYAAMNPALWQRARRGAFERDGWRCRNCNGAGKLEAHHVIKLENGGDPYALDNLLTYCRPCHIDEHRTASATPGRDEWRQFVEELTR